MDIKTLAENPNLARICKAVGSKKRKCFLMEKYTPGRIVATGWDSGCKDEYLVVYANGSVGFLALTNDPNTNNDPWKSRKILPDWPDDSIAIVIAGVSLGKPSTPQVYLRPQA